MKWVTENPRALVDSFKQKPIPAVIEQVRDGSTLRAFLLPDFQYVTIILSGVKVRNFFFGFTLQLKFNWYYFY